MAQPYPQNVEGNQNTHNQQFTSFNGHVLAETHLPVNNGFQQYGHYGQYSVNNENSQNKNESLDVNKYSPNSQENQPYFPNSYMNAANPNVW